MSIVIIYGIHTRCFLLMLVFYHFIMVLADAFSSMVKIIMAYVVF